MTIIETKYERLEFTVHYDGDELKKVYLYVGYWSGFTVDLIDVTEQINDLAKEFFYKKLQLYRSLKDMDKAERFNDDKDC